MKPLQMRMAAVLAAWVAGLLVMNGCAGSRDPGIDAASAVDGGGDAATPIDGGTDAALDAAVTGSVRIVVTCTGAVCNKTGNVDFDVHECNGGAVLGTAMMLDRQITLGVPLTQTIAGVPAGAHCAGAYLDSNFDNQVDTNDAIASASSPVTVDGGATAQVGIVLDVVVQ